MSITPGSRDPGATEHVATARPVIPDYELVRIVGRGSYGDVWLARSVTGAWRAVKIVWRERFANAEPFDREFRGLKEFADVSPGESSQMTLLHVGRNDAAGFFYYVMELADDVERGRYIEPETYVPLTLAELRTRRGRIPADECGSFGIELARVLASLHRCGLVHRDVKPSNVIFVSGVPKLADIGLVARSASAHTFVGTEGYVPPEGPGAPSADVFALAKLLYELCTGCDRQEFPKLPDDLASFPDRAALLELNEIFLRACGPSPTERYRDGTAILADLTALKTGVSLRTRRFAAFVIRTGAAIGAAAALGLAIWWWETRPAAPAAPMPVAAGVSPLSVAVLPFTTVEGNMALEFFADGVSDEILQALQRERDLRIAGSLSSYWAKGRELPKTEIARRLRVAQLVEGSLERVATGYRVDVRLTRGADGGSEHVGTFERPAAEVFRLTDDVARAVALRILRRVTASTLVPPTQNLAAYGEFLRGRALQLRGSSRADDAAEAFKRAVDKDPNFALALARRADALRTAATKDIHGVWDHSLALAEAHRAVALQPNLAVAWIVLGLIRGVGGGDPTTGLADLAYAEELGGPTAETKLTRFLLGFYASETSGLLPLAREAVAFNPVNQERLTVLTLAFEYLGDYAEADRLYQEPGDFRARVYLRRTWRGAEAALRLATLTAPSEAEGIAMRVHMLAELGRVAEAAQLLEGATGSFGWDVYAAAGMIDRARALAEKELPGLRAAFAGFPAVVRNETVVLLKDRARSQLIAAEIVLGRDESALSLLDAWRRDLEGRRPNRRAGGPVIMNLPRGYAKLGRHDDAIALLSEFMAVGRSMGYDLRDSAAFAPLRDDARFVRLREKAEGWAALHPDPADR